MANKSGQSAREAVTLRHFATPAANISWLCPGIGIAQHAEIQMKKRFNRLAEATAHALGTAWAFVIAVSTVLIWAASGPVFHFNDTWQLTINTGTTIVTFLMVFLIQNTQNRDARATQLKLDELLRAVERARNSMVNLQDLTDQELDALEQDFRRLGRSTAGETQTQKVG
ncbi:MAG TPA: low affinity iron permease family protein [Polyangiaceae bacterium]